MAITKRRWKTKPPAGADIDYSHPLSRFIRAVMLINEGGGRVYTIGPYPDSLSPTATDWGLGNYGPELTNSGSYTLGTRAKTGYDVSRPFVAEYLIYLPTESNYVIFNGPNNPAIIQIQITTNDDTGVGKRLGFTIKDPTGNTIDAYTASFNASDFGSYVHLVCTYDGSLSVNGLKIYWNGKDITFSNYSPPPLSDNTAFNLDKWASSTGTGMKIAFFRMWWDIALSAAQVQSLYYNPWQTFTGSYDYQINDGSAGITHALDGSSSGTGTDSGNISVNLSLAGQATGSAQNSGDITIDRGLAGASQGSGVSQGNLKVNFVFDGAAAGAGNTAGQAQIDRGISGQANGTGASSGDLDVTAGLAGASQGSGVTDGHTEVQHPLDGQSQASAQISGQISIGNSIAGGTAGAGDSPGSLNVTRPLDGQADGSGDVHGDTQIERQLSGNAHGEGNADGYVSTAIYLSGSGSGQGQASGEVVLRQSLQGQATGAGQTQGSMRVVPPPGAAHFVCRVQNRYRTVIQNRILARVLL